MKPSLDTRAVRGADTARAQPAAQAPAQDAARPATASTPGELGALAGLGELVAKRQPRARDTCMLAPRPMPPMSRHAADTTAPASGLRAAADTNASKAASAVSASQKSWNEVSALIVNRGA